MTLLEKIKRNNGIDDNEALEVIKSMLEQVVLGSDPEEVLENEGYEPDHVIELLKYAKRLEVEL